MKWLQRGGMVLLGLLVLLGATVAAGLLLGERRASRHIALQLPTVALRSDGAAVERGRYLFASRGCVDCHGASGGGATLVEDGKGLKLSGPNITAGNPRVAAYQPLDWVRSIRHGVGPDGRALRVMPSEDYNRLTDDDLSSIVAYLRQLPPQHGEEQGTIELPLPARVLYGFGAIPEAVTKIDHSLPPSSPVAEGVTLEHGQYVAQMCKGCHGPDLQGGKIPGAPPDWPAAARLAPGPGNVMPHYASVEPFIAMIRSGKRADGSAIAVMPFSSLGALNDTDLRAMYLFLTRPSAL